VSLHYTATVAKVCKTDADCTAPQVCRVDAANPAPGPRPTGPFPNNPRGLNYKCQSEPVCDAAADRQLCGSTVLWDYALDSSAVTAHTQCCAQGTSCYHLKAEKPSTCVKELVCPAGETACGFSYGGGLSNPDDECCKPKVQICSGGGGGMSMGGAYASSCADVGPA
jgi:hypothetical protein